MPYHVSTDEFERIATAALDLIPDPLRVRMSADNLLITVRTDSRGGDGDDDVNERVLGFYQGGTESSFSPYEYPKQIVLLQRNIEEWCNTRTELVDQITDTVLHEVAHYFGMDHDDIRETRLRH